MSTNNHKAVTVSNLQKQFGGFTAVDRISFEVAEGEIFGFLGPNGAGKSTTIKMLCGILAPTSGSGAVAGFDIRSQQEKIKQHIGYMSQRFSLYEDLTIEENIDFYSGIYRVPADKKNARKDWIIEMAGLDAFRSNLTKTLPVGWKQRLALGCAIIHEPGILFLDEPTSGVDPIMRNNFWQLIREMAANGVTVFVTTHYMDEAENCDRLALIYKGTLIAMGTPRQLKTVSFKGHCLLISVRQGEEWLEKLAGLPFVRNPALFGSDIHIIVDDADKAKPLVEDFFRRQNVVDLVVTKIAPSLEDVFVSLIEAYDRGKSANESYKN